jgi:hypothetical protein
LIRFELAPSPALATALVVAHGLAGLAAWMVLSNFLGALLACGLVALGVAAAWSRALLRAPRSLRAVEIEAGRATFELASGARLAAPAEGRRYVTRRVLAVPLGGEAGSTHGVLGRTALVTADMLRPGEFRRLRIWALWNRQPA